MRRSQEAQVESCGPSGDAPDVVAANPQRPTGAHERQGMFYLLVKAVQFYGAVWAAILFYLFACYAGMRSPMSWLG